MFVNVQIELGTDQIRGKFAIVNATIEPEKSRHEYSMGDDKDTFMGFAKFCEKMLKLFDSLKKFASALNFQRAIESFHIVQSIVGPTSTHIFATQFSFNDTAGGNLDTRMFQRLLGATQVGDDRNITGPLNVLRLTLTVGRNRAIQILPSIWSQCMPHHIYRTHDRLTLIV